MASLRARLLAALLGLCAVGLLLLGGITYLQQRSSQYDRIDDQARAAVGAVGSELGDRGIGPASPDAHEQDRAGGPPRGGGTGIGLPAGTYGQRRDASGKVLGETVFSETVTNVSPDIPDDVEVGEPFTVDGKKGDGCRYRVYAARTPFGGGLTIAAVPLTEVDRQLRHLLTVEALVILIVLLGLAAAGWAVVRVGLRPLDRMGRTAGRIAGGDLSHRVIDEDPRTEVGRLGIALNAMLDRLEHAFGEQQRSEDRLRRFIADASHELRTPLASIRGYAELYRIGAASDAESVERSMQRIEDESARMGVLVEDLLTLARLDEIADAPHGEIDLGPLVRDAADDARATDPSRQITTPGDGVALVTGDAHQLRQVLANLTRNALVHTPAGTPIEIHLGHADGAVRLEVRDHGPGLPSDDPHEIFERFWRAEGGRERGAGGAGLGLAIVAAIVDAHGGEVSTANAPGGGASFVVVLPAA